MSNITDEIRDKIFEADSALHKISTDVSKFHDVINAHYLSDKITSLINTAKHIKGQLGQIKKRAGK